MGVGEHVYPTHCHNCGQSNFEPTEINGSFAAECVVCGTLTFPEGGRNGRYQHTGKERPDDGGAA